MLIKIQKRNSGVIFIPVLKGGDVATPRTAKSKPSQDALRAATEWYHKAVLEEFARRGIGDIGYADSFRRQSYAEPQEDGTRYMRLEPWGFSIIHTACEGRGCDACANTGVAMNDSGSTPTTGRARVLACYQAPLKVVREGDMFRSELVKEF